MTRTAQPGVWQTGMRQAAAVLDYSTAFICGFIGAASIYFGLIDGHWVYILGIWYAIAAVFQFLAASAARHRRNWRRALAGALWATFTVPPLGLISLILTLLSRRAFA